jgi:hypothetical protein
VPDYGNALDFGSGGKVDITFGDPFAGADPTTYAWGLGVWMIRGNYTDTSRRLLHMQDQGGNDAGDIWLDTNGRFGVRHYTSEDSAYSTAICSTNPAASTWICVGITFGADGIIHLYLGTETTSMAEVSYFAQNDAGVGWRNMAGFGGPSWIYGERQNGTADWAGAAGDGADELTMYITAPTSSEWEEWRTTGAIVGKTKVLYIASANPPVDAGSIGATVTPRATVALMTGPNVSTGTNVTPSAVAATTTVPAPTVTASGQAAPAAVAAVATVGAPTITATGTAAPSTVAAAATILTPTVTASGQATPATVTAAGTVPAPTVTSGTGPTPATVAANTTVPTPSVIASATLTPATLALLATVQAPTVVSGTQVAPSTIAVSVLVASPTHTATGSATPSTVTVVTTVLTPTADGDDIAITIGQRGGGRSTRNRAGGTQSTSRAGGRRSSSRAG